MWLCFDNTLFYRWIMMAKKTLCRLCVEKLVLGRVWEGPTLVVVQYMYNSCTILVQL